MFLLRIGQEKELISQIIQCPSDVKRKLHGCKVCDFVPVVVFFRRNRIVDFVIKAETISDCGPEKTRTNFIPVGIDVMDCLNTNFHGPIPKDQVESQVNSDVDKDILVEPAIDNGIFFELVIEIVPYDPDVRRNDEQRGYV